jgi:hypothetical protein
MAAGAKIRQKSDGRQADFPQRAVCLSLAGELFAAILNQSESTVWPAACPVFFAKQASGFVVPETSFSVAFPASHCLTSFAMYPAVQDIESKGIQSVNINNFFMRIDFIIFV